MWTRVRRFLPVLLAVAIPVAAQDPGTLAGQWEGTMQSQRGPRTEKLTFTVQNGQLAGTVQSQQGEPTPLTALTLGADGALTYKVTRQRGDRTIEMTFKGTVSGDKITGAYTRQGGQGPQETPFTATRVGGAKTSAAVAPAQGGGTETQALVGTWKGQYTSPRGTSEQTITFRMESGALAGTVSSQRGDVTLDAISLAPDGTLKYSFTRSFQDRKFTTQFTGKLAGTTYSGQYSSGQGGATEFTAKKQ